MAIMLPVLQLHRTTPSLLFYSELDNTIKKILLRQACNGNQ